MNLGIHFHAPAKKTFVRICLCKSEYVVMKLGSICEHTHTNLDDILSVRELYIIAEPSFLWGHIGNVVLLAVCTAVSVHCHMK